MKEQGYSQSTPLLAHKNGAEDGSVFKLHSEFAPTGDQPQAIKALVGVTNSGKTFTMANVIAALSKPIFINTHNKTLAGQLYGEFK